LKIYYFFAEEDDEVKKRCRTLQTQLDSAASRKSALEQTKRDFEAMRQQEGAKKTELQNTLEKIHRKIAALDKMKGLNEEQTRRLADERKQANSNRENHG
jgi:ABC-type transporter Mla subunit MlaD